MHRIKIFLNHDNPGLNFGCRCNQPANSKIADKNSKNNDPAYKSLLFLLAAIVVYLRIDRIKTKINILKQFL